jgi:3-hydroxyisobutyrate dehydrogenase
MITILGTGLLGAGFVRGLRKQGESVRVWNRTSEKARALAALGAIPIANVADAVRGADRVHLVLSDDAAVDEVLGMAEAGLVRGALVIDHTTTSTAGALERTAAWAERGVIYHHAPVFMGPSNAADSTGLMLISGDRESVERLTPMLAPMTGKLVDLGPRVDGAAAFKLLGNLFLMALSAGFLDMLALAQAMGVAPPSSPRCSIISIRARRRRHGSSACSRPTIRIHRGSSRWPGRMRGSCRRKPTAPTSRSNSCRSSRHAWIAFSAKARLTPTGP